jgi:inositol 1,4,5-triphosphate receptor type 1/inositol 1,4,5-triphosphate receptor type 3
MSAWDPVKFFLDTLYFVFFALLFTNIVSGIMIDTFAELRDQRQKIEDDKKNNCFICGIDRPTLEKNNEDFDVHILSKHFLWNYVFYMYTLTKKDSTEYTGLEYWISDKIKNEDILWYI